MALLEVVLVSKSFANVTVLSDISFSAEQSEIVCLLGPSGCGKTTLLRIIAGLETADAGHVLLAGRPLGGVPVHQRGFGLMFQDYALFPHKDVAANVAFGLRMQALPQPQVEARVTEMLNLVGLAGYERRPVYALSGGEQQRVALARSLAPGPRLLMLDEPLGSLDRALREELMNELRAILQGVDVTAIYVTHDQQEAFALADRVIIMNQGRIVQQGTPQAVYRRPASPWVAHFLGLSNLLPGRVVGLDPLEVDTALGRLALTKTRKFAIGQEVTVLIRPEAARLSASPQETGTRCTITGTVRQCSFRGGYFRVVVRQGAGLDMAFDLVTNQARLVQPGQPLSLALDVQAITVLGKERDAAPTEA